MNAHSPPAEFTNRVDHRAAWLARAGALDILFHEGAISLEEAIRELAAGYLAIVGEAPQRLNGGAP
jgi:hypothetical protein